MKIYAGKVLMLLETSFHTDARVPKEAYALVKADYKVSVIAMHKKNRISREIINGVTVYSVPEITLFKKSCADKATSIRRLLHQVKSAVGYIFEYFYFTSICLLLSPYILMREGFDIIHAHNPPDTLFVIGATYRLLGKKFVFDHHDLSPELYLTKFSGKKDFIYRIMVLCEKLSCKIAKKIICTNESYKQIEIERHSIDPHKIHVVRNNPIIGDCLLRKSNGKGKEETADRRNLLFLGSINPQDGLDTLLKSLHYLVHDMRTKDVICNIVGDGDSLQTAKQMVSELNLSNYVDFKGFISNREEIKECLNSADVCVEPAPDNALNRHSTFVKLMEYMAAAKPVVAFDLNESRYSTNGTAILVPPGDIEGFAQAIKKLLDEPQLRKDLGNAGFDRIKKELNWGNASSELISAYKSLYPDN
jgi:glycosyltransferase involved in cell wall biosynthesis